MLFASDFDNGFIGVPFIGVEVHKRHEGERQGLKDRRELNTPMGDRDMTELDIEQTEQKQRNSPEAVLAEEVHGQHGENNACCMAHTLKIGFTESGIDGGRQADILRGKEGMVALFIAAAIVAVGRIIMMQERSFTAFGTRGILAILRRLTPFFPGR